MEAVYEELKALTSKGDLSIIYIDAPPRTVSSALFRSLAQIIPACAYEPFHRPFHGFERGLAVLLKKAKEAGVHDPATAKPVPLVVKEIARYLPAAEWEKWMPLADHFIAIVRDPYLQLHSLVKRAANDLHYEKYGANGLPDAKVWELAERIGNIFRDGGSIAGRPIPGDFHRTGWRSLGEHLVSLDAYIQDHRQKRLMVVDGFLLRAMPQAIMSEILARLGIRQDADMLEKAVSGWSADTGPHIHRPDSSKDDAYRSRVIASTGYEPPLDETPPLRLFPPVLQNYLKDFALPVYLDFLRRPERIGPTTPHASLSVLNKKVDGIRLAERNPVTAYALVASLDLEKLDASERREQAGHLADLIKQFPDHAETFYLIDRLVPRHRQNERGAFWADDVHS
jgi:hypothetical protein